VQEGLLQLGDPVHQLAVTVDRRAALVERLAPQRQGAEVGRVAAQLLGTGLGHETGCTSRSSCAFMSASAGSSAISAGR
jgi:hypothetical protein